MTKDSEGGGQGSGAVPMSAGLTLVGLCFLWGGNQVSIKISNQGIPPLLAAVSRSGIASLLLWVYARSKGQGVLVPRKDLKHAAFIGLLFGVEFVFLYWGLVFTHASRGIIFFYLQPFWTAIGAHFLLRGDRLNAPKVAGLVVAFFGLLAAFWARSTTLGPLYWVGDLMQVGGGLCWAATTLYIKRMAGSESHTHYQTMFSQLFFSIPVLGLAWLVFQRGDPVALSAPVAGAFFYQVVIIAFVSYLSWFWMIHHYSVSRLSAFTFLSPLFGVVLSGLILRESIPLLLWVGLALVGAGIFLVNRPSKAPARA
ncbi:MAG TPA: DMT family transporter [Anaerolineae bacterium]|nr:DMT family transporter [Anaerolineae bacterium]